MKSPVLRILLWVFVGLFVIAFILPLLVPVLTLAGSLLFGWFSFLRRVGPEVSLNWGGIGMVGLCSLLIVVGLHSLCGWLFSAVSAKVNVCTGLRWRWSWSLSLYAATWLLFAAIMGAVGAAHQVGWLIRSGESLYKPRKHLAMLRSPLKQKALNLVHCAESAGWNLKQTRTDFLAYEVKWTNASRRELDEFHVVMIEGTNGSLAAGFLFHRDPELRSKAGFITVSPEMLIGEIQPAEKLSEALARYQTTPQAQPAGDVGKSPSDSY